MSAASDLVTQLIGIATGAISQAENFASSAASASTAAYTALPQKTVALPKVKLPDAPDTAALNVDFDAALSQVEGVVNGLQNSWLMQYFPASLPGGFDPILTDVLNGTLVSPAEQEILWSRATGQAQRAAAAFEDEVVTTWASRGFSLPGGVVANQIQMKKQETLHTLADLAAQQAIKALDIHVEAVKVAADVGVRLRVGLMGAMTGLVTAYARLPSAAAEYATAVSNAKRAAYLAVAEYYRTVIQAAEITLKADTVNADNAQKYIGAIAPAMIGEMANLVHARVGAATSYAQVAAASLTSITGIAADVNQTTS